MKQNLFLTFLCFNIFINLFGQFDERFYYPSKEYRPIEGLNYEDIFFDIDTITLHGLFLKSDTIAKATIVFYIGSGGNISTYTFITRPLVSAGYNVFMLDFRGYGKSTGNPTHINRASDAQIVLDSILKIEGVKDSRVIVYGASIGTQIAVKIAKDNQDVVDGLILDCPMSSFTDIAIASSPEQQKEVIEKYVTSPYSAKEDIKDIEDMPKMIILSKEDEDIPFKQGELVYNNANQPKTMWLYEGKHLESVILDEELYIKKIYDFTNSLTDILTHKNYKLRVQVSNLENNLGQVVIQLNDSLGNSIDFKMANIDNNQCEILFDSILPGKYTITYFHDENNNGKFDANFMGIPKEGYGFSNNASGKYGPPAIEEQIFIVSENTLVQLEPFYW